MNIIDNEADNFECNFTELAIIPIKKPFLIY